MRLLIIAVVFIGMTLFFWACGGSKVELSKDKKIIKAAIKAHGGELYETVELSFVFRERRYTAKNNKGLYEYTLTKEKDGQAYFDVLTNDDFTREIDGKMIELSEEDKLKYAGSLSSVIYFAQLPYKLEDPAIISEYKGTVEIKGQTYETIEIKFKEENGGQDHEDIYYYWINEKTKTVDYLAYKFLVNGGGVRFRSAYNPRVINGIRYQDYINYKAPYEMDLKTLPQEYEAGKLEELSKIELEQVK